MSRSIYNSTYRLGLYTFLHSLRSNLSPSRPLQLWFEARETSLARNSMNVFEAVQFYQACMSMSRSIYNPIYRLGLYTFLHSLHSNFSPSRPLQLWFEAACEASLARDKYAMQCTPKIRRGCYSFICPYSSSWMISVIDKKHGTCLRNGRGCAAWALISYCNHVVVGATSSNLCIMCCMNVL